MIYRLKGSFQAVVRWMAGNWMTANQATLGGWIFVALSALALMLGLNGDGARLWLAAVPILAFFRLTMNALDGMLAREQGTASVAGDLLNEASDVLGDTVAYGALWFVHGSPRFAVFVFIVLCWATEFCAVLGRAYPGGVRRHESAGGGKADRAVWISILAICVFFAHPEAHRIPVWIRGFLAAASACMCLTCVLRVRAILIASAGKPYQSYTPLGK